MHCIYTIVAYNAESDEVVVDKYLSRNVEGAIQSFWSDGTSGESRRNSCQIIAVFSGNLDDMTPTEAQ